MERSDFPWELGVFDAHCHPTDTMDSIKDIALMKATALTIMSTREEDQRLVSDIAIEKSVNDTIDLNNPGSCRGLVPSFGWHPWFSHKLFDDVDKEVSLPLSEDAKVAHYQAVLSPKPEEKKFILDLPDPQPLSKFLEETSDRLRRHPRALVGEVGLDKAFRIPQAWMPEDIDARDSTLTPGGREGRRLSPYRVQVEHQQKILLAQLRLAAKHQRAVSVHGVQVHGVLFETLRSLWKSSSSHQHAEEGANATVASRYPPRVCLHSYSGSVDTMKQYLRPSVPVDFYFSFSIVINFSTAASSKTEDVIRTLNDSRILTESDMHIAGQEMDNNLEAVVRKICDIKGWELREGVQKLAENWKRFIEG